LQYVPAPIYSSELPINRYFPKEIKDLSKDNEIEFYCELEELIKEIRDKKN